MTRRHAALAIAFAATLGACAGPSRTRVEPAPAPAASVTTPAAKPSPSPEPPRQADQLARIASELVELQNAMAKLILGARQHDEQLLYMQRRLTDLEGQMRGRASTAPTLPPSASMPAPLPPPPFAPSPPAVAAPPAVPRAVAPSAPSTLPSATPRTALPSPSTGAASTAEDLYREGLSKYQGGDLDGAVVTLYEVVANYPTDPSRERAQFLVGDIFFEQKDYRGAIAELEGLINAVPGGARVPEALLKIGMAQRSLGDEARARRAWERLVKEYPSSAQARQARSLLRTRG